MDKVEAHLFSSGEQVERSTVCMKAVAPSRLEEMDNVDLMHNATSPVTPRLRRTERFDQSSPNPCKKFSQLMDTQMTEHSLIPRPLSPRTSLRTPIYPNIPVLSLSDENDVPHEAQPVIPSTTNDSSSMKPAQLCTIAENKPPFYRPTTGTQSLPPAVESQFSEMFDTDSRFLATEQGPTEQVRTMTMSTVDSIASYPNGVIYIKPSPQLQSMQAVKEHVKAIGDPTPYGPWTRSKMFRTQSDLSLPLASYVPTGSPRAVFTPLENVDESAFGNTRPDLIPPCMLELTKGGKHLIKACDCAQPTVVVDGPTKWIEGYLVRKADADRQEEEQRRKDARAHRWDLSQVDSLKQVNKMVRKLSLSTKKSEREGFEVHRDCSETSKMGMLSVFGKSVTQGQALPPTHSPDEDGYSAQESHLHMKARSQAHSAQPLCNSPLRDQIDRDQTPHHTKPHSASPSRPTLKKRFHTVSGASVSKYLIRKMSLRQINPQDEDESLQRSVSTQIPSFLEHKTSSVKSLIGAWERLGGKGKDERNRKDSGKTVK